MVYRPGPLQRWKEHRRNMDRERVSLENQVCAYCGSTENLERHHITYKPSRIVILCQSCHNRLHNPDFPPLKKYNPFKDKLKRMKEEEKWPDYQPEPCPDGE